MAGEPFTLEEAKRLHDPRIRNRVTDLVFGGPPEMTVAELREEVRKLIAEMDKD